MIAYKLLTVFGLSGFVASAAATAEPWWVQAGGMVLSCGLLYVVYTKTIPRMTSDHKAAVESISKEVGGKIDRVNHTIEEGNRKQLDMLHSTLTQLNDK